MIIDPELVDMIVPKIRADLTYLIVSPADEAELKAIDERLGSLDRLLVSYQELIKSQDNQIQGLKKYIALLEVRCK